MHAVRSPHRLISGVAAGGILALGALAAPGVHAATLPHISATVAAHTTIQVSGYGFGPGDRVEVVDATGRTVLNRVFTTATLLPLPTPRPPACTSSTPCQYSVPAPWGRIAVTMPPRHVHCVYQLVQVRAHDLTRHISSNTVTVALGFGLC